MANPPQNFYEDLPVISGFDKVVETDLYHAVPPDWQIVIADVRDSTRAIERGKYKEVNLIGASCIIAALNVCTDLSFPYVFGGDGATLVVPPTVVHQVSLAILATQNLARDQFGLDLRVGVVPVSRIIDMGACLRVAKVKVSENFNQAMFHGGGLTCAETLLKNPLHAAEFQLQPNTSANADYSGLECRWRDIPSSAGETHSIIIRATGESDTDNRDIYREVLAKIGEIYGSEQEYHPIPLQNLHLSFSSEALAGEASIRRTPVIKLLLSNLLGKLLFSKKSKTFGIDWNQYKTDVRAKTEKISCAARS